MAPFLLQSFSVGVVGDKLLWLLMVSITYMQEYYLLPIQLSRIQTEVYLAPILLPRLPEPSVLSARWWPALPSWLGGWLRGPEFKRQTPGGKFWEVVAICGLSGYATSMFSHVFACFLIGLAIDMIHSRWSWWMDIRPSKLRLELGQREGLDAGIFFRFICPLCLLWAVADATSSDRKVFSHQADNSGLLGARTHKEQCTLYVD